MTREIKIACFIGAIAGATPLLISLISVDAELIVDNFVPKIFIGYMIKTIGLMLLGAFVVFVNSECDLKKAFQLGIMAPALVVGTLNANNFNEAKDEISGLESELENQRKPAGTPINSDAILFIHPEYGFSIIKSAYASEENALIGMHNEPSTARLLWYGITGNISNGWFVIVGSHKNELDAENQAKQFQNKGYDARVYPPFGNNEYFGVVIGAYLPINIARELRDKAVNDGLPKDSYLWKWKN